MADIDLEQTIVEYKKIITETAQDLVKETKDDPDDVIRDIYALGFPPNVQKKDEPENREAVISKTAILAWNIAVMSTNPK
jgi:hypothetical protein